MAWQYKKTKSGQLFQKENIFVRLNSSKNVAYCNEKTKKIAK